MQVTPDVAEFKERLQQILPGEQIEVRTANDGIVLSGQVSSTAKLDRALDLANRYAPGPGVEPDGGRRHAAGHAEGPLRRNAALGLQEPLGVARASATAGEVVGGSRAPSLTTGSVDDAIDDLSVSAARQRGGACGAAALIGGLEFAVLLEALEAKGMVRTLAEPNLTALSGQEAKFLAGGEYPIPVASGNDGDHHRIQALRCRTELHARRWSMATSST